MKPAALLVLAITGALGWAQAEQRYDVAGMVIKVEPEHREFVVSCRAIPGYMEAMVMPFTVRNVHELDGLAAGASVEFTLVVDDDNSFAEKVNVLAYESLERDPSTAKRLGYLDKLLDPSSVAVELQCGQAVPDFSLIDQNRHRVELSQFTGKVVALTFIYTRCPLPNYCFRLSNNFGRLQTRFANRMGRDLVLLSISFDPVHDQPDVLAKYGAVWRADARAWRLLTGPPEQVQKICRMFGMDSWPEEGLITHSLHTAVIDRQGKLAANIEGNQFTAEQLGDLVQSIMDRPPEH